MSSYAKALEISNLLKESIQKGEFELTEPVAKLPNLNNGCKLQGLIERDVTAIKTN